jgi:hypothetical protein
MPFYARHLHVSATGTLLYQGDTDENADECGE